MTAAATASWELVSRSGRDRATWVARGVENAGPDASLVCDIDLAGRFFGDALDEGPSDRLPDFRLQIRGLAVRVTTLQRLHDHLQDWLDLPLAAMRTTPLRLDCDMGGLFDQDLRLILGERSDTLSAGHSVATVKFLVGRMTGEMSFVTDQTCLAALRDGLAAAILWSAGGPPRG